MIDNPTIDLIIPLVKQVIKFDAPVDKSLTDFFYKNRKLSQATRRLIVEIIYGIVRNYFKLTKLVDKTQISKLIGLVLQEVLQISPDELKKITKIDFKNLSDLSFNALAIKDDALCQYELPMWLYDKLKSQYTFYDDLCRALLEKPSVDLRVNILKMSVKDVFSKFKEEGLNPSLTQYSPYGIRLMQKVSLKQHPLFASGAIEFQDESSQIAAMLLAPRRKEMVVDFCAGSGGKSLLFGMLMHNSGRIYAFDVHDKRLDNLTPRLVRSGLSNIYPQLINNENDIKVKRLYGKIDRVFVDAPCSGVGTLRRNPELKFRQNPQTLIELSQKQASILNKASKLLKVGGHLVYATCSLLREENEDIVENFLAQNPNFIVVNAVDGLKIESLKSAGALHKADDFLRLFPNIHGVDGFFAALLKRIS